MDGRWEDVPDDGCAVRRFPVYEQMPIVPYGDFTELMTGGSLRTVTYERQRFRGSSDHLFEVLVPFGQKADVTLSRLIEGYVVRAAMLEKVDR